MTPHEKLFESVSVVLKFQPLNHVIPVLITASARALAIDANGDMEMLEENYTRFCKLVRNQIGQMIGFEIGEVSEAIKQ